MAHGFFARLCQVAVVTPCLLAAVHLGTAEHAVAQPPLPGLQTGGNLARLPNDQVEGAIWEYKGALKRRLKEGEKSKKFAGKFRVEDSAVFAVGAKFRLAPGKVVKEVVDAVRTGEEVDLSLPDGPQPKRIGEFHRLRSGRLRIEFNDQSKGGLHGVMIVQLKKNTDDVYIGTFTEMAGKKKMDEWQVELRMLQD